MRTRSLSTQDVEDLEQHSCSNKREITLKNQPKGRLLWKSAQREITLKISPKGNSFSVYPRREAGVVDVHNYGVLWSCNISSMDMLKLRRLKMKLTKFSFKTDWIFHIILHVHACCGGGGVCGWGPSEGECTSTKTIAPHTTWTGSGMFTGLILIRRFLEIQGCTTLGCFLYRDRVAPSW